MPMFKTHLLKMAGALKIDQKLVESKHIEDKLCLENDVQKNIKDMHRKSKIKGFDTATNNDLKGLLAGPSKNIFVNNDEEKNPKASEEMQNLINDQKEKLARLDKGFETIEKKNTLFREEIDTTTNNLKTELVLLRRENEATTSQLKEISEALIRVSNKIGRGQPKEMSIGVSDRKSSFGESEISLREHRNENNNNRI